MTHNNLPQATVAAGSGGLMCRRQKGDERIEGKDTKESIF